MPLTASTRFTSAITAAPRPTAGGTITKWSWTGSAWTLISTITAPGTTAGINNDFYWMSGSTTGTTVNLLVTVGQGGSAPANTGGGTVWDLADTSGYNNPITGTAPLTTLVQFQAGSNEAIRGAAMLPVTAQAAPTESSVSINPVNPETGLADAAYAAQRSRVTSVLVTFGSAVTASNFDLAIPDHLHPHRECLDL